MKILITGGAGFIGSAVARHIINHTNDTVMIVDCLTYAGNLDSLSTISKHPRYTFKKINICDPVALRSTFEQFQPDLVMHLAAETHVDRAIDSPEKFIETNIFGTYNLLEISRQYWQTRSLTAQQRFRFLHISTDEVYGTLSNQSDFFTETCRYAPNNPYSASKASSDHLVRAWHKTYGLPTIQTNCSNNYGPYHFPEKLIPLTILNALEGKNIPIYGNGNQIRDWLYVEDHARALYLVVTQGKIGESYNIGGNNERKNIEVVQTICGLLNNSIPNKPHDFNQLISFVTDRQGHDTRYAIDASKIRTELGWQPQETFESGLQKTVEWYLNNAWWWRRIKNSDYLKQQTTLDH